MPPDRRFAVSRSDWMEPCYELRRPELVLLLDLARGHVDRAAFVAGLVALDWPEDGAAELAELISEWPRPAEGAA